MREPFGAHFLRDHCCLIRCLSWSKLASAALLSKFSFIISNVTYILLSDSFLPFGLFTYLFSQLIFIEQLECARQWLGAEILSLEATLSCTY